MIYFIPSFMRVFETIARSHRSNSNPQSPNIVMVSPNNCIWALEIVDGSLKAVDSCLEVITICLKLVDSSLKGVAVSL